MSRLALAYGYIGTIKYGYDAQVEQLATQIMIWCIQDGWYNNSSESTALSYFTSGSGWSTELAADVQTVYYKIKANMLSFGTYPSFNGNSKTMAYDSTSGTWSVTITDSNGVANQFDWSSAVSSYSYLSVSTTSNSVTFTSTQEISSLKLTADYNNSVYDSVQAIQLVPVDGEDNQQETTTYTTWNDSPTATITLSTEEVEDETPEPAEPVDVTIKKTTEYGSVSGFQFYVWGTTEDGESYRKTVTTTSSGVLTVSLEPGIYYVKELEDTSRPYYIPNTKVTTVSVVSEVAEEDDDGNPISYVAVATPSEISYYNELKKGNAQVIKTSEDGIVSGLQFHLYGTADCGMSINLTATTDSNGIATFTDVPIGTYTMEEINTPARYVIPASQTVTIYYNQTTKASFYNKLKKFQVKVTKADTETGEAQGDATLAGAVYGIYKDGQLIDTYATNASGSFTTDYYICGDDWEIREIYPSEGYLLDTNVYHIAAEPENFTSTNQEYNTAAPIVSAEQVIKGSIALIKHTDDGDTQIETPETSATFEVYLKASGSYDDAAETERDILVCDSDGYAQTKELPYGVYTVHQTYGWEGRELMADFDVYISEDGQIYRYLINNSNFESYIRIVKKDAETGKTIPCSGVGFQIYDPDGNLITMSYTYPSLTTIDTFYTDSEGYLITPEALAYGKGYSIVEVSAPYGYVLNSEPVYFDVAQSDSTEENGYTVIEVVCSNIPQKGTVTVTKTGEIFSSVVESDGIYQPVYDTDKLSGAVYEITAAEDIYTLDGTLRAAKGEVVDTITTGEDGTATSKELYLGSYEVKEITAPYGMVVNEEINTVTLTYAGQEIAVTYTSAAFYNERQKAVIDLYKAIDTDDTFGLGTNGEIGYISFGLYAAEELTAADGTVIPADGLIEILFVGEDGHGAFTSDVPFGSYYVQEISTDEHYILNGEKYTVAYEYAGQGTATVYLTANDGEAITNQLIYGTIKGYKKDYETGNAVKGAVYGLFSGDETDFAAENAILTAVSDEDGIFAFENVPYGSYCIKELETVRGFLLNDTVYSASVTENEEIVEFTAVNYRKPQISTTATTEKEKETFAVGTIEITDIVSYKHLIIGEEYTVTGVLMNKATGEPYLVDGEEVTAEVTFIPSHYNGKVQVTFVFDASGITEKTDLVVFEKLYSNDIELAVHANINDERQTVTVHKPEIQTTADIDGAKDAFVSSTMTVNDVVSYTDLIIGKEYTVTGVLMNKATGEPYLVNGEEVTAETTFTAETADGEVTVTFTFNGSNISTHTNLVVFEKLYCNDIELAVHADIADEGQTVTVHKPRIGTTANVDGEKEAFAVDTITITDIVSYSDLIIGRHYTVSGVLMDKATGNPYLVDGKEVTAGASFTANSSSGSVRVTFTFDASGITENTDFVVYERLYYGGRLLASHAVLTDEGQTVTAYKPEIGTTADIEGEKEAFAVDTITITDIVSYSNLIIGKEYTATGVLMDKATGNPYLVGGKEVTAEAAFTAETADGEIEVLFTFDGSGIVENTELVVFESLYYNGIELAVHSDITDEGQTVTIYKPEIKTTADIDGEKEAFVSDSITITDIVSYSNLIVGKEYTVSGVLMDKATGEPYLVGGEEVTAEVSFTAETADGEIEVMFTFDGSGIIENTELVVFESLYYNGIELAVHADITDEGQTVVLKIPPEDKNQPTGVNVMDQLLALGAAALAVVALRRKHGKKNK